jgi:hypothetical protein
MKAEQWNERGYGLVDPTTVGDGGAVDSIVSTRGVGGYSAVAAAPTPAFDVFVDEEFEDNNEEEKHKKENSRVDDRSLRQRLDGGTVSYHRLH